MGQTEILVCYKITWKQKDFENVSTHDVSGERRKLTNGLIICCRHLQSELTPSSFCCQHHHELHFCYSERSGGTAFLYTQSFSCTKEQT